MDAIIGVLSNSIPKRIAAPLKDKKNQTYAFIHFGTKAAADAFVSRRENVRVDADNIFMHAVSCGEFKNRK